MRPNTERWFPSAPPKATVTSAQKDKCKPMHQTPSRMKANNTALTEFCGWQHEYLHQNHLTSLPYSSKVCIKIKAWIKVRNNLLDIPCIYKRCTTTNISWRNNWLVFLKILLKQCSRLPSFLKSKRDLQSVLLTLDTWLSIFEQWTALCYSAFKCKARTCSGFALFLSSQMKDAWGTSLLTNILLLSSTWITSNSGMTYTSFHK